MNLSDDHPGVPFMSAVQAVGPSIHLLDTRSNNTVIAWMGQTEMEVILSLRPLGKPRQTQSDKWKERPEVIKYRTYCDKIRLAFGRYTKFRSALVVNYLAVFGTEDESLWGQPHGQKPDLDNIHKGILDALFLRDEEVAQGEMAKIWGPLDELHIYLEGIRDE